MSRPDELTKPATEIPADSGIAGLTTAKLISLTIQEVWQMCGEDRDAFAAMVNEVAVGTAKYHGLPLPDSDLARERITSRLQLLVESAPERLFASTVDQTVQATTKYVKWVEAGLPVGPDAELEDSTFEGTGALSAFEKLSPGELASLTVEVAWLMCGQNSAAFSAALLSVAEQEASRRGIDLAESEASRALLSTKVEALLESDPYKLLTTAIDDALLAAIRYSPVPAATIAAYNEVRNCKDKRTVCHAPSTSMYFGRDGYVTACCYSRHNRLGQWPAQSVSEIWSGAEINEMREQMRANILPMGCETCADQLRAHNFKGLLAGNFDSTLPDSNNSPLAKLASLFRPQPQPAVVYPVRLEFELSNKCNLECEMCSGFFSSSIRANRENKPALPQIYDERFVEQLKPFIPHLKVAKFFGGEPFLIDIYYDIWELFIASNPKCEIIITTNGTVFTNKVQRVLEHLNFQVVISLDSVNKPTYENIRRNATMERTLENLEKYRTILQSRGKTVVMAVCPMVHNWREIPDLIAFANQRSMPVFFNTVTFPESASLKYLPVAEQRRVAEFFRQAINQNPRGKIETANSRALTDLSHQVEMWCAESTTSNSELLQIV